MDSPIFQEGPMPTPGKAVVWGFDAVNLKPPHFHGQLEVLVIRSGTACLRLGASPLRLRPRTLVWVLPGITHFVSDFSGDFDMWVLGFEPEHVQMVTGVGRHGLDVSPFHGWLLPLADSVRARPVVELSASEFDVIDSTCHVESMSQRGGLEPKGLDEVLRIGLRLASEAADPRYALSMALHASCLIAENVGMDRDALCRDLDVSPSYLARLFKRELRSSFVEYRARARIAAFLAFARQGRSLLNAGYAAGFGSYSQLFRTFAQTTDWTPRDYLLRDGRTECSLVKLKDSRS